VAYNAKSWTLSNERERALMTGQSKALGRIHGPTYENDSRRIKMNQEMYNKLTPPDFITVIKV
jgi:hypothetical protein